MTPPSERHDEEPSVQDGLTLDAICACGHPRIDHGGLRIDICGPCLECDCEEFTQVNSEEPELDILERLHALMAQADRLQEAATGLQRRLGGRNSDRSAGSA